MIAFRDILDECRFNDWEFQLGCDHGRSFLQCRATTVDNCEGSVTMTWSGRKWPLSPFMTKSEVVQTAFKAVMTAMEHEVREQFLYRGRAIFGPHFDVDLLHEMAGRTDALDERKAA